jgi:hypothetical protein
MKFIPAGPRCYVTADPAGYTVSITGAGDRGVYQAVHGESLKGTAVVVAIVRGVDLTDPEKRKAAAQEMRAACVAHAAASASPSSS